jgi:hypothetical protein
VVAPGHTNFQKPSTFIGAIDQKRGFHSDQKPKLIPGSEIFNKVKFPTVFFPLKNDGDIIPPEPR